MKFVVLAIHFAIFVAQSFHLARKILLTFSIFATFAIFLLYFSESSFFKSFFLKLRKQFASKFLLTRTILDISAGSAALECFIIIKIVYLNNGVIPLVSIRSVISVI